MDDNYRKQMIDAGRGYLIAGPPLRTEPEHDEDHVGGLMSIPLYQREIAPTTSPTKEGDRMTGVENDPEEIVEALLRVEDAARGTVETEADPYETMPGLKLALDDLDEVRDKIRSRVEGNAPPLRAEPEYESLLRGNYGSRCILCHGDITHGHPHGTRFPGDCSYPQTGVENDPED